MIRMTMKDDREYLLSEKEASSLVELLFIATGSKNLEDLQLLASAAKLVQRELRAPTS